ncbi:MAG: hypothetical protein WAN43_06150 [Rhodomicrobium sp.]
MLKCDVAHLPEVMAGLDPAIQRRIRFPWMAASSAAMTRMSKDEA